MISIWEFSYLILCTVTYRWELDPCNKDSHPSHPSHPSRPSRVPVMMNIFFELSRANYLVVLDFISMLELLLLGIQVNILWGLLKAILRIPGKGILSDRYVTARCMAWWSHHSSNCRRINDRTNRTESNHWATAWCHWCWNYSVSSNRRNIALICT